MKEYSLKEGDRLAQYRILRPLGRGGMGEVYEVEHTTLDLRYALKLLPADFASRVGALKRFRDEARVMANLQHPHIIKVDDFGETDGKYWLRMELAEGLGEGIITLEDYAEKDGGSLDQGILAGILVQILEGLSYAHQRGVIHRDLKPGNILLTRGTDTGIHAKISDFGLVKIIGEEFVRSKAQESVSLSMSMGDLGTLKPETGSSTNALLGTYEYMSPEQKRGEEADERSDIYAVGLIMFRLLTGQKELGFELPSQINPGLSASWDNLVRDALRPDRERRLGSARDMLDMVVRIEKAIKGEKEPAERESMTQSALEETAAASKEEKEAISTRDIRETRDEEKPTEEIFIVKASDKKSEGIPAPPRPAAKRDDSKKDEIKDDSAESPPAGKKETHREQRAQKKPKTSGIRMIVAIAVCLLLAGIVFGGYQFFVKKSRKRIPPPISTGRLYVEPEPADATSTIVVPSINYKMVYIPPGSFMMGSPASEKGRDDDETQHRVTLTQGYYLGVTEVTQGQWRAIMGSNPSSFRNCGDDCPVESVSWEDCQEFIRRLNQREGIDKYRLPTEAEWEYACRAGTDTPFAFGNCLSTQQANYDGNYPYQGCSKGTYRKSPISVGSFSPNAWGLYDMHGNVWEWCQDWKGDYPSGSVTDPKGPSTGSNRVYRGGSWYDLAGGCRSADRHVNAPGGRGGYLGFRLARTL